MDTQERKYRFTEIVTAITLLPDLSELDEPPTLPNRTIGLSDGSLKSALASQAFREGEDFSNKLVNALVASAMFNIKESDNPTADDMSAMGLAMSLAWAHNEVPYFLALSGLVSQVFEKCGNDDNAEFIIPTEVMAIIGTGNKARSFGQFEPYDLLDDKVSVTDLLKKETSNLPDDIKQQLIEAIQKEIDKNE